MKQNLCRVKGDTLKYGRSIPSKNCFRRPGKKGLEKVVIMYCKNALFREAVVKKGPKCRHSYVWSLWKAIKTISYTYSDWTKLRIFAI